MFSTSIKHDLKPKYQKFKEKIETILETTYSNSRLSEQFIKCFSVRFLGNYTLSSIMLIILCLIFAFSSLCSLLLKAGLLLDIGVISPHPHGYNCWLRDLLHLHGCIIQITIIWRTLGTGLYVEIAVLPFLGMLVLWGNKASYWYHYFCGLPVNTFPCSNQVWSRTGWKGWILDQLATTGLSPNFVWIAFQPTTTGPLKWCS